MLIDFFENNMLPHEYIMLGILIAFGLTFLVLSLKLPFLPQDQGRAFAVNGELSKGKLRGVGLVIIVCDAIISLLFVKVSKENMVFLLLLLAVMLSGYLDDASKTPWNDYKKGLIDLIISIMYMLSFVKYNNTDIYIFDNYIQLNPVVYCILGVILIWISINVVNCSDGVDGLCGSLTIVSVLSFVIVFGDQLGNMANYSLFLVGCILAYLYFNTSPSSMLMGDAGSRAFGFFLAVLAMKSGHPISFLVLVLVMIIDGGLGLVKIFLLRFLKIKFLANTRTPIHDEMRKNRGWSDTQVVVRFCMIQIILALVWFLVIK